MNTVDPLAALFPPIQAGIGGAAAMSDNTSASTSPTNTKDAFDWSALFQAASAPVGPTSIGTTTIQPAYHPANLYAGSPEVNSVGSPASARDFDSPLFDFELPYTSDNAAALFPPEQPGEVADWLSSFNLSGNAPPPSGTVAATTSSAPAVSITSTQMDVADFLRTAAQLTAQQHSSQASSVATDVNRCSTLTLSQQQDQAMANTLANSSAADMAASQQSIFSTVSSEDDFAPIRAPVNLASGVSPSPTVSTAGSVSDLVNRIDLNTWSTLMAQATNNANSSIFSQESMASSVQTLGDSQRSSRGASPTINNHSSGAGAVHTLATVFVREYARTHPVHDIDVLVRGLRLAGIEIADDVLRDIVGPSPLSLGSPASQVGNIAASPSVSAVFSGTTTPAMSAVNSNANYAMLMSGLGVAGSTQSSEIDTHSRPSFSQSTSVSSLSSLPDFAAYAQQHSQQSQQSSQLTNMSQAQSDDGWASDASWTPYTQQVAPRKAKVTPSNPVTPRSRSSVSAQHTSAKADILGAATATSISTHHGTGSPSTDGLMTKVYTADGKRHFSCNVCHKLFERAYNLRTHYDTHKSAEEREKGKRFICPHDSDECGKSFARKHDCIRHWRTVHGKAIAGSASATAIGKLKAPNPIIKTARSSSSSDEDELDDEDEGSDSDDTSHEASSASASGSSFG
ncbi:hypothetical protein V8E36_002579 [Tilletia maclaganii]